MSAEGDAVAEPRPGAVRSAAFMLASFPLRIVQFVLIVVMAVTGVATTIAWVGIPILIAATALVHWFGGVERRWVSTMLDRQIPPPDQLPAAATMLHRWRLRLIDPVTWRTLGYLLLAFPLGIFEFVVGVAGIVLVPVGIFVVPWLGWLHAKLAYAMLGPDKARRMAAKAQRLQASRARGVEAAEAERRRIEHDLHDGAQQRLVSVAMSLGRARSKLDSEPAAARDLINEAHTDAKLAVAELRDLARGIYPAVLGDRGLDAALSALAAKCPVPVEVAVDDGLMAKRPPRAVESCAYFEVGETLANVAKHAEATRVAVKAWRADDTVVVEVTDDGKGGAELRPGGGLAGLADRASTIDGVVTVISPAAGPTVIRADLPASW